jgi:hypothetical protein
MASTKRFLYKAGRAGGGPFVAVPLHGDAVRGDTVRGGAVRGGAYE